MHDTYRNCREVGVARIWQDVQLEGSSKARLWGACGCCSEGLQLYPECKVEPLQDTSVTHNAQPASSLMLEHMLRLTRIQPYCHLLAMGPEAYVTHMPPASVSSFVQWATNSTYFIARLPNVKKAVYEFVVIIRANSFASVFPFCFLNYHVPIVRNMQKILQILF